MPGVHVRTPSQLDWVDQEKESLLTIPGSYWLCHKKNIYKFIFRYHRTVKNTMQFSYGRELLKIIRRIVKCHPTQGQQFGTRHLLVTYNCTSWTRQDKMFAIMKFHQQNNAAAFSHAFVLTIRIFSSSEHSLFDLKYPIVKEADADTTFKDLNISLDTEEKIISDVTSATDKVSPRTDAICHTKKINEIAKYDGVEGMFSKALETSINSNFQDNTTRESAIVLENLDDRIKSATTTAEMHFADKHNIKFHNDTQENKSINCNIEGCEKNIEQYSRDGVQEQSLRVNKADKIKIETYRMKKEEEIELPIIQKQNRQTQNTQKYKETTSLKSSFDNERMTKDRVNEWLLTHEFNFDEKLIEKDNICAINNKDNSNDSKETTSGNIDSSNASDQHVIQKEVKDVKPTLINQSLQENLQTEIKNINKDYVPKIVKENNKSVHVKQENLVSYNETTNLESQESNSQHARILTNIDDKSENNVHSKSYKNRKQRSRESERRSIPDKILRSSDITDLVMEGLMFTIRQDQDSVAVIEQKTKLEVDEVLENSEKVETKAGEKCLLNSSLLRLENLVTMIDSPRSKDEQQKNRHEISNNANLSPFNIFHATDTVFSVNINDVEAGLDKSSVSNYDRHNAKNHLNLHQLRWQHQRVPSNIKYSDSCSASGILTEKRRRLTEWQGGDDERDKKNESNTKMIKQGDVIPEISPSKKINAGVQNTNSLTINRNIEAVDRHDKSTEKHYNFPLLSPSTISTETTSVISKEFSLIKLPRQEASVPRIVSNKPVTIEQMSPVLQKVLRHTCRKRKFSSTTGSGILQQNERKTQPMVLTGDTTCEKDEVLPEDKCIDPNVANSSLSVKFTINSEEMKSNNEKSCVTVDKDVPGMTRNMRVRSAKGKNATHRTLRRSSSSKHDSPRKLQDITEEFYYDLLNVHNKDNAIRQRCLRQKQKSLNNLNDIKSGKVRIEMLKFIQDITEGARVVVKRLNIDNKSNLLEKNSNLI